MSAIFSNILKSYKSYLHQWKPENNGPVLFKVAITHAEGTNQACNSLGNKTIEPIRFQLNASEYFFVSSHLRILKSAQDNMLLQQSFERIIWLFATLSFQDHN